MALVETSLAAVLFLFGGLLCVLGLPWFFFRLRRMLRTYRLMRRSKTRKNDHEPMCGPSGGLMSEEEHDEEAPKKQD